MKLTDFPIVMNGITIPEPIKFDAEHETIENVSQSEAGTDLIEILRYGKMSYACEFNSSSTWAHRFAELSETDVITLSCYDLKADASVVRNVRMRDFKAVLVDNSQRIEGIKGLYKVTFKLEEF